MARPAHAGIGYRAQNGRPDGRTGTHSGALGSSRNKPDDMDDHDGRVLAAAVYRRHPADRATAATAVTQAGRTSGTDKSLSPGPAGPPRAANRLRGEGASEELLGIGGVAAVYLHPEAGKGLPHGDVQAVPGAAGDPRLQSPKSYAVVNKDPAEVAFGGAAGPQGDGRPVGYRVGFNAPAADCTIRHLDDAAALALELPLLGPVVLDVAGLRGDPVGPVRCRVALQAQGDAPGIDI